MYLIHNGTVRSTARSLVREGNLDAAPVTGMELSCDREKMQAALAEAQTMEGVVYVRAWVNEGRVRVGDDIMLVLIGADTRPHAVEALQALLKRLKNECLTERELC
jgi:molybdopterin synthase catalytic subunit